MPDYNPNKKRVCIAFEYSGTVRDAFIRKGHYAISCDLLPSESDFGPHHQGDYRDLIYENWDILIAHPPCTFLTCSAEWAYKDGPYHQKVKDGTLTGLERRLAREDALIVVDELFKSPAKRKCIENPKGVISTRLRKASQYIQPHDFGDDASKITGLWLENLPLLEPTLKIPGRVVEWPIGSGKFVERWSNQTDSGQNKLSPHPDRAKHRAKFYQGWADAMAEQWGRL